MTALGDSTLVTAIRQGNGTLKLITWKLANDGAIERLGDSGDQAGAVSIVTITAIGRFADTVVTAVRNGSGILELIAWHISAQGSKIERIGDSGSLAGAVSEIAMVRTYSDDDTAGQQGVLTAVRAGNGTLKLIAWRLTGSTFERRSDSGSQAGEATQIAVDLTGSSPTYLASMLKGSGDWELIAFNIARDGAITRTADLTDAGSHVTETALIHLGGGRCVVANRSLSFMTLILVDVL
jgi:hypothetical protein